jgi:hypothetical protein
MGARRWVILSVGVVVAAGLGVAAWLFGEHGVEFASWLAGVAGLVVAAAALVVAWPGSSPSRSGSAPEVSVGRDNSGIISTGDGAQITQHPK